MCDSPGLGNLGSSLSSAYPHSWRAESEVDCGSCWQTLSFGPFFFPLIHEKNNSVASLLYTACLRQRFTFVVTGLLGIHMTFSPFLWHLVSSRRASSLAIYSFASLWCQRCVVVSNSYSIHGQHFGKVIDSHHFIVRLNDAPVKEHKKDMGERTRIRLSFPESILPNPLENHGNGTLMVFVPFKPLGFLWLREVLLKTRNKMKVGFWHQPPQERNGNLDVSSRRYATTGISALNLALHMCQEVNIAGFGYPGNRDNTTPIYYYNMGHSWEKEHNTTTERNCPSLQAQNC
uniref:Uncharacterized protein n=1 Tax=Athene cunicularia TaxID=194338 RepID=A0A663NAC4_ATHCN